MTYFNIVLDNVNSAVALSALEWWKCARFSSQTDKEKRVEKAVITKTQNAIRRRNNQYSVNNVEMMLNSIKYLVQCYSDDLSEFRRFCSVLDCSLPLSASHAYNRLIQLRAFLVSAVRDCGYEIE